jgi:hypothetical protein
VTTFYIQPTSVRCKHDHINLVYLQETDPPLGFEIVGCIVCNPPKDGDIILVTSAYKNLIRDYSRTNRGNLS